MSSYRRRLFLANQAEKNICFYGNSVQDGTPTPETPIDIMSVENPTIKATGKNLFNNDTSLIKVVTYKASDAANVTKRNGYEIKLQPGTYTIKARHKAETKSGYIYGAVVDKNDVRKQTVNAVQGTYLPEQIVFNIESGDTFKIYDGLGENSIAQSQNNFNKFNIQIESGTIATEYERYEEEIIEVEGYTLRGIRGYRDRIYTKEGSVWFEQKSGWYETDANTILYLNKANAYMIQAYVDRRPIEESLKGLGAEATKVENDPGLTTHFIYSHKAYEGGQINTALHTDLLVWFLSNTFESIDEWNAWVENNKVCIVYPLLNPVTTEITGTLAEKILAIDKSKNITITSANGVVGEVEVIAE